MSNSIIPEDALDKLAQRYGLGKYAEKGTGKVPPAAPQTKGIIYDGNWFVFDNLEFSPNRNGTIRLSTSLLDNPSKKNQTAWWTQVQNNPAGGVLYNGVTLYQIAHRLFSLRDDPAYQEVNAQLQTLLQQDWQTHYPHTGTRINYGTDLETTIEHLQPDGSILPIQIDVPEFTIFPNNDNWSYLVLANEQPESELGTVEPIPSAAVPLLENLLGSHYEEACAVFQYLNTRKDGNLREVRLWVPSVKARPCQRALVFGVYDFVDRFVIFADVNVNGNRPARGWSAQKVSNGNGGKP